eukprot:gene24786-31164_t
MGYEHTADVHQVEESADSFGAENLLDVANTPPSPPRKRQCIETDQAIKTEQESYCSHEWWADSPAVGKSIDAVSHGTDSKCLLFEKSDIRVEDGDDFEELSSESESDMSSLDDCDEEGGISDEVESMEMCAEEDKEFEVSAIVPTFCYGRMKTVMLNQARELMALTERENKCLESLAVKFDKGIPLVEREVREDYISFFENRYPVDFKNKVDAIQEVHDEGKSDDEDSDSDWDETDSDGEGEGGSASPTTSAESLDDELQLEDAQSVVCREVEGEKELLNGGRGGGASGGEGSASPTTSVETDDENDAQSVVLPSCEAQREKEEPPACGGGGGTTSVLVTDGEMQLENAQSVVRGKVNSMGEEVEELPTGGGGGGTSGVTSKLVTDGEMQLENAQSVVRGKVNPMGEEVEELPTGGGGGGASGGESCASPTTSVETDDVQSAEHMDVDFNRDERVAVSGGGSVSSATLSMENSVEDESVEHVKSKHVKAPLMLGLKPSRPVGAIAVRSTFGKPVLKPPPQKPVNLNNVVIPTRNVGGKCPLSEFVWTGAEKRRLVEHSIVVPPVLSCATTATAAPPTAAVVSHQHSASAGSTACAASVTPLASVPHTIMSAPSVAPPSSASAATSTTDGSKDLLRSHNYGFILITTRIRGVMQSFVEADYAVPLTYASDSVRVDDVVSAQNKPDGTLIFSHGHRSTTPVKTIFSIVRTDQNSLVLQVRGNNRVEVTRPHAE